MTEPTPVRPAPSARPQAVTVAFWCWAAAAVLLIVGGLLTAVFIPIPVFRGTGIIIALAGAGMAFVAGRTRLGDKRFCRAAIALSLAIVVIVGLAGVAGFAAYLPMLALLPLIAGTVSITRPAAQAWFDGEANA